MIQWMELLQIWSDYFVLWEEYMYRFWWGMVTNWMRYTRCDFFTVERWADVTDVKVNGIVWNSGWQSRYERAAPARICVRNGPALDAPCKASFFYRRRWGISYRMIPQTKSSEIRDGSFVIVKECLYKFSWGTAQDWMRYTRCDFYTVEGRTIYTGW